MKKLYIGILFIIITSTLFGVTFRDCQNDEWELSASSKDAEDTTDYTLQVGLGTDISFVPDEIEISYTEDNCTGNIIGYHAHNRDSTSDEDLNDVEVNLFLGGDFSYVSHIKSRVSPSNTYSHLIQYGTIYKLSDAYTVTMNTDVTSGDPFNGNTQNAASFIQSKITFGSDDVPCEIITDRRTEEYAFTVRKYKTDESADDESCPLTITATSPTTSETYQYTSNILFSATGINESTFLPTSVTKNLVNSNGKHVGYLSTNFYDYQLYDLNENLLE